MNPLNQWDLFLLTVATGEIKLLTSNGHSKHWPDFSPDGSKVLYTAGDRLWSVNVDGTGLTDLGHGHRGRWSPDGTKIVFTDGARDIYIMDADGSNRTLLDTRFDDLEGRPTRSLWPDWQPLPVNTPSSYARPKSANRVQFSLVPAYEPCVEPNRAHGPPLAFPSCAPPAPGSSALTVGVGDGHPAAARSIGSVRLKVTPGVPGGVDDTTGRVRLNITNVMRASDLSEYSGELRGSVRIRVTDVEGDVSSTTQDFPLEFTVPCVPTDSTLDGATCTLGTDLDAIVPGATPEGTRAVWQLDQAKVYDGGPDEDADTPADNSLFAVQGVFVP
jgi:dipeptidyl aminopeptidase/acylaminoacyl peptidase